MEQSSFAVLELRIEKLESDLALIREQASKQIEIIREDMRLLHSEMQGLSSDLRKITTVTEVLTAEIQGINVNLSTIAKNMESVNDLYETWNKLKGFWSVMTWLKNNATILIIVIVAIWIFYVGLIKGFKWI